MNVQKAVVTAAGRAQRGLPLQTLVDRDGVEKKALQIILEEAADAGVGEVCLVIAPGDEAAYRAAAGPEAPRLHFVVQEEPLGYGHAVLRARGFVADQAFLHLVSDHLSIAAGSTRSAKQVVDLARSEGCAVSAVQPTRENMLRFYGAVGGRRVALRSDLFEIQHVLEKPTPSEAEQVLSVPGLRAGYYLCFFGVHVLTPAVMDVLADTARQDPLRPFDSPPRLANSLAASRTSPWRSPRIVTTSARSTGYSPPSRPALDGVDRERILASSTSFAQVERLMPLTEIITSSDPKYATARLPRRAGI